MEAVEDEPAEPSTDDFRDNIHDAASYGHTAGSHHPNSDDRIEASTGEGVNCDE